jgi:hypothetical protein
MPKLSLHSSTVNASSGLNFSDDEKSFPMFPISKRILQSVTLSNSDHNAYLFNSTINPSDPENGAEYFPGLGFNFNGKIDNFKDEDMVTISFNVNETKIQFEFLLRSLKEFNYHMPQLLIPIDLLPLDCYYKRNSFFLTYNNITYKLIWTMISEFNSNYVIVTPVNMYDNKTKICKKPAKTYHIKFKSVDYIVVCQYILIDNKVTLTIPEFLFPGKKFDGAIYVKISILYLFTCCSCADVAKEMKSVFKIKINRSTVYRTARALLDRLPRFFPDVFAACLESLGDLEKLTADKKVTKFALLRSNDDFMGHVKSVLEDMGFKVDCDCEGKKKELYYKKYIPSWRSIVRGNDFFMGLVFMKSCLNGMLLSPSKTSSGQVLSCRLI